MATDTGEWVLVREVTCSCGQKLSWSVNNLLAASRWTHGDGEAQRTFTHEEILASFGADKEAMVVERWLDEVHAYEGE